MRALVMTVLALLASCRSNPRSPTMAAMATVANVGGYSASPVPPGWVAIEPDDERMRCANYAVDWWRVAMVDGTVQFTQIMEEEKEADTGPELPFTPQHQLPVRGIRHVLPVSDGFLVGFDGGEWIGALFWFSPDGTMSRKLSGENVIALVPLGPDLVASFEGLSHLTLSEGYVRWLERKGGWRTTAVTALDAAPRTFAATVNGFYVLTTESLTRLGTNDRKATPIQPIQSRNLYPRSMVLDRGGTLWIGMRQLVLRLSPNGERFTPTWLVRQSCVRATVRGLNCVCDP